MSSSASADSPRKTLTSAVVSCLFHVGVGIWLAYLGTAKHDAPCPAAPRLAVADVTLGAFYIVTAAVVLGNAVYTYLLDDGSEDAHPYAPVGSGADAAEEARKRARDAKPPAARVLEILQLVVVAALVAVFLWATVLVFEDDLWVRMKEVSVASSALCDRGLYRGSAVTLLVIWALVAVVVGVVILVILIFCCCACACGGDTLRGLGSATGMGAAFDLVKRRAERAQAAGKGGKDAPGAAAPGAGADGIFNPHVGAGEEPARHDDVERGTKEA
jgi:hypothetical protein